MKSMFCIQIDDIVQAVSPSLENALNALPDIIYDYTGVKITNPIELIDNGQSYYSNILVVGDEVLTITITKKPVI